MIDHPLIQELIQKHRDEAFIDVCMTDILVGDMDYTFLWETKIRARKLSKIYKLEKYRLIVNDMKWIVKLFAECLLYCPLVKVYKHGLSLNYINEEVGVEFLLAEDEPIMFVIHGPGHDLTPKPVAFDDLKDLIKIFVDHVEKRIYLRPQLEIIDG